MKYKTFFTIKEMIFMALCSDIGIVVKKLISPFADIVTGYLHIPGGISSAISLSFIVVAAVIINRFGSAMLMSVVQCVIALSIGSVGSMGVYSIVAYFVPGLVIDVVILVLHHFKIGRTFKCLFSTMLGSLATTFIANILVFNLRSYALVLYASVGAFSGAVAGVIAMMLVARLKKIIPRRFFRLQTKD